MANRELYRYRYTKKSSYKCNSAIDLFNTYPNRQKTKMTNNNFLRKNNSIFLTNKMEYI